MRCVTAGFRACGAIAWGPPLALADRLRPSRAAPTTPCPNTRMIRELGRFPTSDRPVCLLQPRLDRGVPGESAGLCALSG